MSWRAHPIDPTAFLPTRLVQRLSGAPGAYRECRFEGAALFADISGYVELTERLCHQGERGLSELSSLLDRSFSRYIEVVGRYGGEVAYFAGDGLAAYWAADASLAEASARAVACAVALRELDRDDSGGARRGSDLHVGVAAGTLWAAQLRSLDERFDLLLGGSAMRRAAHAGSLGARGEVVASREIAALLGSKLSVQPGAEDFCSVRSVQCAESWEVRAAQQAPVDAALARRMLSGALAHLRGGALDWSAELREVCVLFARIEGLDETKAGALDAFQVAARVVHETMRDFASATGQLLIDDKGLVYHIAFGAPFNTHADDCSRASQAALALQDRLSSLGLGSSIGLASGQAFCGVVGNATRRAYVTIGRPMNLAARLMLSAADGVRCTAMEPSLIRDGIERVAQESLRPKGIAKALPTFRLRRAAQPRARAKICGRCEEQALLTERSANIGTDGSAVIAIVGEAGFGKSSLLRELCERTAERGIMTAVGQADASPSAVYSAWANVFETLFDVDAHMPQSKARAEVLAMLDRIPDALPLAPLLNAVLPLDLPDTDVTRHLDGWQRADTTMRLLVECLQRLAQKPMLVVLEDGHWMDSSSWRLCEQVIQQVHGLLLCIGARPMPSGTGIDALPKQRVTVLTLGGLSGSDVSVVMCDALGARAVSDELSAAVHRVTDGNPLFVHEYALLLREQGLLRHTAELVEFRDAHAAAHALSAPLTVQAAITSRLDTLSQVERLALKTASVVGQGFDAGVLEQVYPVAAQPGAIEAALESLCAAALFEPSGGPGRRYVFRHALIRDVAYNVMPHPQRAALHRSVAEVLLAQSPSETAVDHALLTHHFEKAGELDKTVHHAQLAARSAILTGAYREAARLLETCLELADQTRRPVIDQVRWRRMLADAQAGLGDSRARLAHAKNALALAPHGSRIEHPTSLVTAVAAIARRAVSRGRSGSAKTAPSAVRELDLELTKAHRHIAEYCYLMSDASGLISSTLCAIVHAQRHGPSADLASAYAQFAGALVVAGLHPATDSMLAHALRVAQQVEQPQALAYAHMVRALYSVGMARWEHTHESVLSCQQICEQLHDPVVWGHAQWVAFWASYYRGETEDSGRIARSLLQRAEKLGHLQHTGWGHRALALYELSRGAPAPALEHIEHSVSLLSGPAFENEALSSWGICALARHRTGDAEGAHEALERALPQGAALRRPVAHAMFVGWSSLAEVTFALHAAEPQAARWQSVAEQALQGLKRHARIFPVSEPTYRYWQGLSQAQAGQPNRARKTFRQGLEAANRLGARHDEARILESLATPQATARSLP